MAASLSLPEHKLSHSHSVQIDALGGGALSNVRDRHVVIKQPSLRFLDVSDCPDVCTLDLRSCAEGMHIMISGCPALHHISVSDNGQGAVVHINSSDRAPDVEVDGLLDQIDACWSSGRFALESAAHPWYGGAIRHQGNISDDLPPLAECQVYIDPVDEIADLSAPWSRCVLICRGSTLQQVVVHAVAEKADIALQALPRLVSVKTASSISRLSVTACPLLSFVEGQIAHCHLHASGSRKHHLLLAVHAQQAVISHCQMKKMTLTAPTNLSLIHCTTLADVSLPELTQVRCEGAVPSSLLGVAEITVNESLVKSLVAQFCDGGGDAVLKPLVSLLPLLREPGPSVRALLLLSELLANGAYPALIWQMRMQLSARHQNSRMSALMSVDQERLATAAGHWHWHLPDDLGREAWLADYRIWKDCAPYVEEAGRFRHTMASACVHDPDGPAMATVIAAIANGSRQLETHEVALITAILRKLARLSYHRLRSQKLRHHALRLAMRYDSLGEEFDRYFLACCEEHLLLPDLLDVLDRIGRGHTAVRMALFRISLKSREWLETRVEESRQVSQCIARAMAMALAR